MRKDDPVLVVDGYNIYIRYFFSKFNKSSYNNSGVIYLFLNRIFTLCRKLNIPLYNTIVVFDRGAQVQKAISPDYKSNRASLHRVLRQSLFSAKLKRLLQFFEYLKINYLEILGIEADLIIGYICRNWLNTFPKVYILSNDNDFWQLLALNNISLFYKNGEIIDIHNYDRYIKQFKYCPPFSYPLYKAIKGDVVDNVKGVGGIGDKTLEKLFYNAWIHKRVLYSVDDLIKFISLPEVNLTFGSVAKKILDNIEKIRVNYRLVNILESDLLSLNGKIRIDSAMQDFINLNNPPIEWSFFKELCLAEGFKKFLQNGEVIACI